MAAAIPYPGRDIRSDQFTDPMEESMFQGWYGYHAKKRGLNPDPDDGGHHYDYRSAYKSGASPDNTGHWPSEFKTLGHPDLIVDSDVAGQFVNTKTGEKIWNPAYYGTGNFEALFDPTKRPKMLNPARPRR